jgi:hypothetical protein
MQTINNREISSTEYFNESTRLYEKQNIAVKYIGLALIKVSIVIHTNIYSVDTPEDSNLKKGVKYIGRTFFNVAKAIDKTSYLSASSIALSAGLIANYVSRENTVSNQYANNLIYCGGISLATIISCSFFNSLNVVRKDVISKLNYIIAARDFSTVVSNYVNSTQQLNDLYLREISIIRERITTILELNSRINNLNIQLNELIVLVSNSQNRIFNHIIAELAEINLIDTIARENEIIAYDELKLYTGDHINPKTLTIISQVTLENAEQPVFCENQLYEYKHLVTWHKMPYPNIDATCPHNRNKLIWSNVQRINKQ